MEEKRINIEIGNRLRFIRSIFNEGSKLSAEQFAYLLDETRDRVINYELGRASIPIRVILELYKRGINPVYLIAGEGEIYAKNSAGKQLKERISEKERKINAKQTSVIRLSQLGSTESKEKLKELVGKVAAGKIPKSIKES